MRRLLGRRMLQTVPVVLMATLAVFLMVHFAPGDPASSILGLDATPEQVAALKEELGLNEPLPIQYGNWLLGLAHGDLGESIVTGIPVSDLLRQRIPATVELAVFAFAFACVVGIGAGVLAAARPRSVADRAVTVFNGLALAVPNFWLGILLILLFSLRLRWLPAGGRVPFLEDPVGGLKSLILPGIALGLAPAAAFSRLTRASMVEQSGRDYVTVARAKGISEFRVSVRHVLRNSLVPIVTVAALRFGSLIGGAVVIESVFAWPGLGRLMVTGLGSRDYPVVQAALLFFLLAYVFMNLLTDLSYPLLDRRIQTLEQKTPV